MSSRKLEKSLRIDLYKAFMEARKRKLSTANEFRFEMHHLENLQQLGDDILSRRYRPSRGVAFVKRNPVIREIFAAPFRDRVVHHYIISHVEQWWDHRFIYDSYSCRKGKGTDLGVQRLYYMMRRVSQNFHRPTVVLKYDIQGYFTSLPRQRLYDRALWGLKRQYLYPGHTFYEEELYSLLKFLWGRIIFDDPTENVTIKGKRELWQRLPRRKSLFGQDPGVGIVIGNLTSQVLSNVYLDQLDRFITHRLGYKYYGRYVDDFFLVLPAAEVPHFKKHIEPVIENFITGLGLTLHPEKRLCQPIEKGVPFLGARLYPYHILPDHRTVKNYRKDLRRVLNGNKNLESIVSYLGRMQHFDSQHIQKRLWYEAGFDYKLDPHGGPNARFYTDPKLYNK